MIYCYWNVFVAWRNGHQMSMLWLFMFILFVIRAAFSFVVVLITNALLRVEFCDSMEMMCEIMRFYLDILWQSRFKFDILWHSLQYETN